MSIEDAAARLVALRATTERSPAYGPTTRDRPTPDGGVRYVSSTERIVDTGWVTIPPGDLQTVAEWQPLLETMQGPLPDGWRVELKEMKHDPAAWHRDEAYDDKGVKTPAVTRPVWRYTFRAVFDPQRATSLDLETLIAEIKDHEPAAPNISGRSVGDAFGVVLSDWQIGKCDGHGLKGTIATVLKLVDDVDARVDELRRMGRDLDDLTVFCAGDLVEGCDGWYDMQTFSVEADRRDQVKIARRLLRDALVRWSRLFNTVTVTAVGGNHGENRKNGKSFTSFNDNDDVALVEQVAEILSAGPAYEHVTFVLPSDELAITVPMAGYVVGLHHGHFGGTGSTAEQKIYRWYAGQAAGKLPIGDADLLLTAHYHFPALAYWGGCTWLQSGTCDGGSRWYTGTSGKHAQPAQATFTLTPGAFLRDIAFL